MKKLLVGLLAFAMAFALCACGGGENTETADVDYSEIKVDADAGTVTVYGKVNAMYMDQSTMHFLVFEGGNVADKSMIKAFADSQDFYDAMIKAGGQPGNETTAKLENGDFAEGQELDITLTWDGQDTPVNYTEFVKLEDGSAPAEKLVFGGNKENNNTAKSGCLCCNNSCWAGIVSNAAYAFGAVDAMNPAVFLNDAVCPADGTIVAVTFTLK